MVIDGQMFWNFMHTDAKSLNKHRHGELVYKRYTLLEGKEKGLLVTVALEFEA
ncbi:hypothetical protein D3C81_2333330 [compost metagenome]